MSLASPALAGGFSIISTSWEVLGLLVLFKKDRGILQILRDFWNKNLFDLGNLKLEVVRNALLTGSGEIIIQKWQEQSEKMIGWL